MIARWIDALARRIYDGPDVDLDLHGVVTRNSIGDIVEVQR